MSERWPTERWYTNPRGERRRSRFPSQAELDAAHAEGQRMLEEERAERIKEYENSPEQADWDADEEEEEFHVCTGEYCDGYCDLPAPNAGSAS